MEARQIIAKLVSTGTLAQIATNIAPPRYAKDLEQEVAIALLEKDAGKIERMHADGYLHYYAVRVALNLYRGPKSPFAQKFRHLEDRVTIDANIHDTEYEPYQAIVERSWEICLNEIERWAKPGDFPYDKHLLAEHMKTWNMKRLSQQTGIPYRSICYSIEKIKERLKKAINENL